MGPALRPRPGALSPSQHGGTWLPTSEGRPHACSPGQAGLGPPGTPEGPGLRLHSHHTNTEQTGGIAWTQDPKSLLLGTKEATVQLFCVPPWGGQHPDKAVGGRSRYGDGRQGPSASTGAGGLGDIQRRLPREASRAGALWPGFSVSWGGLLPTKAVHQNGSPQGEAWAGVCGDSQGCLLSTLVTSCPTSPWARAA